MSDYLYTHLLLLPPLSVLLPSPQLLLLLLCLLMPLPLIRSRARAHCAWWAGATTVRLEGPNMMLGT